MTFMNPKHWGVLLCSFLVLGSASAQSVEYPFNPDSNGDNLIYTADILEVLAVYETEFDPEPITVDGITLEEYLIQLNEAIEAVEAETQGKEGWSHEVQQRLILNGKQLEDARTLSDYGV